MTAENPADTVIKQAARAITAALADAGLLADHADRAELQRLRDERHGPYERAEADRDDAIRDREHADKARMDAYEIRNAEFKAHQETLVRLRVIKAAKERAEAEVAELRAEVSRLSMAKVNQRDAETEAADAVAELAIVEAERGELEHRLACLLCELTGGRMSGTNYDVPTMVQEVEAHFERTVDDEITELRATIASGQVWYSPGYISPITGTVCVFGNTTVDPEFTAREVADLTTQGEPGDADLFVAARLVMPWKRAALDGSGEQQ